ncbi:hypothetical protein D3C71_2237150 [compost metagenome]
MQKEIVRIFWTIGAVGLSSLWAIPLASLPTTNMSRIRATANAGMSATPTSPNTLAEKPFARITL